MKDTKKDIRLCPVCRTENSPLSVTCKSCGAYVQDRVASLHLFETLWMLIESPFAAMQRIIVAGQKNYIYLLQVFFGVAYVAFVFWLANIGLLIDNLQIILALILVIGPMAGIVLIMFISMISTVVIRAKIGRVNFRDVLSIISYAGFPIVLSVVFVFPGEVGIFGMYLFTNEPSPFTINPVVYGIILGLDALLIIWSVVLLYIGFRVLTGIPGLAVIVSVLSIIAAMLPAVAAMSIVSVYEIL